MTSALSPSSGTSTLLPPASTTNLIPFSFAHASASRISSSVFTSTKYFAGPPIAKVVSGASGTFSFTWSAILFLLHTLLKGKYLIPQERCSLKVEPIRCVVHLAALFAKKLRRVATEGCFIQGYQIGDCALAGTFDIAHDVVDALYDRLGRYLVLFVVRYLNNPTAIGLANRTLHRARHLICIQYDAAMHVARRPPYSLDERCLRTQEAFFVGI